VVHLVVHILVQQQHGQRLFRDLRVALGHFQVVAVLAKQVTQTVTVTVEMVYLVP
jgi:hypothetical protein